MLILFGRPLRLNKGQIATKQSIEKIKAKLPFKMVGLHPDSGGEFINFVLKGWCDENQIDLTRSRSNHKNDNAYVEQKNGHVIRRYCRDERHRRDLYRQEKIISLMKAMGLEAIILRKSLI